MIITPVCGIYAAMLRNKAAGGGYYATGRTVPEAIANVLRIAAADGFITL